MEKSSLTFQTFKNITYNTIGYVWPMIFTLFVTPIIIYNLGVKNYGIYIFVNTIISFLGILDFGIGITITRNLAYYLGGNNEKAIRTVIHTGNTLFLITSTIGLIASLIITSIMHIYPQILPSSFINYAQYSMLIFIAGAIFFVNTIDTAYGAILYSLQRFDINNGIGILSITLSSLITLSIVLSGGSLVEIFLAQLFVSLLISILTIYYGKKILPQATLRFGWDKAEVKKSITFSAVISLNNIANNALNYLDRLIIPFFVGPTNLTYYSIPGNVTTRIPTFANTLSTTMFPTASNLDGSKDKTRLEALYVRSFRLITMISAAITITAIAFAYKVLFYWLNPDFANTSTHILIILAVTNFALALSGPLSNFLLGLGKLKFITTMSVTMGILNALSLVILLPRYGILGAAWAYFISIIPVGYMFFYTEKNYLSLSGRKKYYLKKIYATLFTSFLVWTIDTYIISPLIFSLGTLILGGIISVILYIILYKILGFFENEDWNDIKRFSIEVLRKIRIIK